MIAIAFGLLLAANDSLVGGNWRFSGIKRQDRQQGIGAMQPRRLQDDALMEPMCVVPPDRHCGIVPRYSALIRIPT